MKPNNTNQPPQSATGNGSSFDMVRHGTADTQSVDTLQPFETSLSSQAAVNQGNALDTASLPDSDNDMPTPPKQHMPRNRMLGLGLLAFGIMAAILLGIRIEANKSKAQEASLSPSAKIQQQSTQLSSLSKQLGTISPATASGVTVNGSLVLAPSSKPSNPTAGQLFFNQAANQLQYYDGKGFVSLQGGGNVTNNVTNVYNSSSGGNTNVTNVTNNINQGALTGSGAAGTLAVFGNGGNTLAESLLNQSGTTLATTAQALQGNDSQGLSILTANASGASGGLTLQSGDSSTTGSGDVNIDTGSGVINGTVIENDTFESGLDNFLSNSWVTDTQSNVEAHSGTYSLAVTISSNAHFNGGWNTSQFSPNLLAITAGHEYYFSAWVRTGAGSNTDTINYSVQWYANNTGQQTGSCTYDVCVLNFATTTTTGWTHLTGTYVAPSSANYLGLFFSGGDTNGGDVQYIDDVTVTDMNDVTGMGINIGGTNAQSITIGNMSQVGNTTITGGSTGINITDALGAINIASGNKNTTISGNQVILGSATLLQDSTNSTQAFQIQNASSTPLFVADTTNMIITIEGTAGAFATLSLDNSHLSSSQTNPPTIGTPINCGTGPTAAITAGSTDTAGSFTITTGSGTPTTCDTTITFNQAYSVAPKSVILTPTTTVGGATVMINAGESADSTTSYTVQIAPNNASASTKYSFNYLVVQ